MTGLQFHLTDDFQLPEEQFIRVISTTDSLMAVYQDLISIAAQSSR